MRKVMKKYVENHWWAFLLQAIIGLVFGLVALFAPNPTEFNFEVDSAREELPGLIAIVALALVLLGLIEVFRTLISIRTQKDWVLSLIIAVIEVGMGAFLFLQREAGHDMLRFMVGAFMILKGFFDIIVGLAVHDDSTDRFIWAVAGIAGAVCGMIVVNYPNTGANQFVAVFGAYALIFGVANFIYSIHSKSMARRVSEQKTSHRATNKTEKLRRVATKK